MGTYRKEWDCCGSVTETNAWEPEECPFCTPPPQRKPLTDKEIDSFREANSEGRGAGWRFNFKGFARAIEAAYNSKE